MAAHWASSAAASAFWQFWVSGSCTSCRGARAACTDPGRSTATGCRMRRRRPPRSRQGR
jgi:hypothetical protein